MKLFQFSADLPQDEILYWYNLGQFVEFKFGGPHFKAPNPPLQLDVEGADGVNYSYLQYCTQEWVCRLLFLKTEGETVKLLADLDALKLAKGAWQTPSVLPYTWNDTNRNGLPELAITFLWGNSYDGSEVHIFEVQPNDTVVDLTAKVRGIITPWEFDPRSETFMVVDPAWAEHDCIYPGSPFSYWLYKWDGKKYSDATASGAYNLEGYIHELTSLVEGYYGEPFTPDFTIGPMVSVLLIYDKMGQRDAGWEAYLEMANPENWPGTDEAALEILQKDVTHFTRQYNSGQPFTPLPCSN